MIRRTAEADVIRLRKYEIPIKRVARNLCLDPALIAGIISQESRAGLLLDNGWDQGRQKYGLMQVHQSHEYQNTNGVYIPGLHLSCSVFETALKCILPTSKVVFKCYLE